ncbi:MAG: O-antigen ligase family protein [Chloroflexota bacterium]|nr:O-antigen ligase family protein [Dehalococcoidia bacterium]MDW8254021.1 O-antigen ligase family protein [Chloroflexota bacterium]
MTVSALSPAAARALLIAAGLLAVVGGAALGVRVHPVAGFALVLGIAAGIGILVQPLVGFVAFILTVTLLPFAVIPIPIGGVRLTFVDAILASLLLLWILRLLLRRQETVQTTPLDGPILVFIGLAIASFIFGIQSTTAELTRFFLKTINGILFFFTVVNMVDDRPALRRLAQTFIVGATGASLIGIVLYFLDQDLATRILLSLRAIGYYPSGSIVTRTIAESQLLRAVGTSVDPNVLAGTLLLTAPYTATQLFSPKPVLPRVWLFPAFAAMLLCLVLTFSRSSWAGAMAAGALLATLRYRRIWLVALLVAATIAVTPWGDLVVDRFQSGIEFEDRAAQMRLGEYRDALRLIQAYPWFGVGFGAAPDLELYIAASSVYLLIAEQMGLVGLSSFLIVIVTFYVTSLRAWRQLVAPEDEAVLLGAIGALTGALVAGVFDHYFFNLHFPQTIALFWMNVGIAMVARRLGRASGVAAVPRAYEDASARTRVQSSTM